MTSHQLSILSAALIALAATHLQAAAQEDKNGMAKPEVAQVPAAVMTWKIGGKSGNVRAEKYQKNEAYNLLNTNHGRYLTWGKQHLGINLVFTLNASERKVHFALPTGEEREIKVGEPVALGIGGGEAYLCYAKRDVGINLKWQTTPCFEWRILNAKAKRGDPIKTGETVAIGNVNVPPSADFLIHFPRPGADVGWTTSPPVWTTLSPYVKEAVKVGITALVAM